MSEFSKNLERVREKIEGASRLHQYFKTEFTKNETRDEMVKLAEKLGIPGLWNRLKDNNSSKKSDISCTSPTSASTPFKSASNSCICTWNERHGDASSSVSAKKGHTELLGGEEDEEEHSKLADSGLGGCERCEGNDQLLRVCSCQSFEEASNMYDKR